MALAISELIQPWWLWTIIRLQSLFVFTDEFFLTISSMEKRQNMQQRNLNPSDPVYPLQIQDGARIGSAISSGSMILRSFESPLECKGLQDHPNPDIVGSGVRLSMYILLLTVFVSLFIGSFHSGPSGTKELGIATLISTCQPENSHST